MWYHYNSNSLNEVFKDETATLSLWSLLQVRKINTFEIILIGDLIVAGLSQYQNVRDKFLKPLKALNCGVGGGRIQHVLWRALIIPVSLNLKNVVLCGPNNLLLDSPKDIADGILEIARSFETNYSCVSVSNLWYHAP